MGLSETIMAAMIGALATVTTALFQLFSSFKQQRNRVDVRPKNGSTMRSVLAVLALMIASAAGGFLYSEFIKQRSAEDMRAMHTELKELRSLIVSEREPVRAEVVAAVQSAATVTPCVPQESAPTPPPPPPASAPAQVPAVIAAESLPALPATTAAAFTEPAEPR